jgi:hypothetical protein
MSDPLEYAVGEWGNVEPLKVVDIITGHILEDDDSTRAFHLGVILILEEIRGTLDNMNDAVWKFIERNEDNE